MPNTPWTDKENDLIVADYFAMLANELAGHPDNKAERRRNLMTLIGRSEGSIERKHQNISAVLKGFNEDWINGYKPLVNFQASLVDAVARWLDSQHNWRQQIPPGKTTDTRAAVEEIWVGPSPTLSNVPKPKELEQTLRIARKFDAAGRDERNRALGRAGEERVVAHERFMLRSADRDDLARKVRWISEEEGDGAGYDIASFTPNGRERLIEVKTTNGWEFSPFHISRNELAVANERSSEWCLFRLWNFTRRPRAFELYPPLEAHLSLTATSYLASFD